MKIDKLAAFEFLRTAVAIVLSLLITFIIILFVSKSPIAAVYSFLLGPLTTVRRMGNVVELMIPLMFTGLATVVLFRAGLFNLSVEGGFFIGSVIAAVSALSFNLPPIINIIVAMLLAALAGGVTSFIPGVLKVKCGANEIVTSLMLNYVMLDIGLFIIDHFIDPSINSKYSYMFDKSMLLPRIIPGTRINIGLVIVLLCIVIVHFILARTPFGFKTTLVGQNPIMSRYSGINNAKVILGSQILGGMIAGLGSSVELFGMYRRFQYQELTGYGWDGILIAIVAHHQPKYVPIAALFLAYLRIGADIMSRESDVPFEIVKVIQAIVIILISAQAILSNYRKRILVKEVEAFEKKEVANGE